MRRMGIVLGGFVMALVAVELAIGQVPFGGFGGGGFGGGGQGQDPVALLRIAQVKKELEITDEQMEKLPAALNKALKEVLDEKQHKRLRQIQLQLQGVRAYTDADVQQQLKITAEQKENIKAILDDQQKEFAELAKAAKGGGFEGFQAAQEKRQAIEKDTTSKVNSVLTADQRKAFRAMTGEEFKLETKGFGAFGGKGFGGKKKKDIQE